MADVAAAFDPFTANGFVPRNDNAAPTGTSAVIDVGGPAYSADIPAGQQGSELAPSNVSGTGVRGAAPTSEQSRDPTFLRIVNDMLDERGTPPVAGIPTMRVTPQSSPPKPAFDPFAANGFVQGDAALASPTEAAPGAGREASMAEAPVDPVIKLLGGPYPPTTSPEFAALPWDQRLKAGIVDAFLDPNNTRLAARQSVAHGATLGFDEDAVPAIAAGIDSLVNGTPFADAYDQSRQEMKANRQAFEKENPKTGTALELAGGLATTPLAGPLFGATAPGASILARGGMAARNVVTGAGLGAVSGFGQTDGDLAAREAGARQGAEFGGALSTVAPMVGAGIRRLATAVRPSAAVDTITGQALRDSAGLAPTDIVPTPAASPVPGMPVGVGGAFNSPGLAATERLLNTSDNAGTLAERTAQNLSLTNAMTGPGVGGVRLARPMAIPDAAAEMTQAMQTAHGTLRDEEHRLWSTPAMVAAKPDIPAAVSRVQRSIAALPSRFQNAMTRNADVYNALQDLYNLPRDASLADLNRARSEILEAGRGLPYSERFAKRATTDAAQAVLEAIESNPGLRTNPQALTDYTRARAYSSRLNSAFEKPQFQAMVNATAGNRKALDPAQVGQKAFSLAAESEKTPGGVGRIVGMLDDLRRTWGGLATANAGVPIPGLNPATAFTARAALAQGYRNVIVNSILEAATSTERDLMNNRNIIMNRLSDTIDRNLPWITRSGALTTPQIDALTAIKDAAIMAAKRESLRGGRGSETFERAMGDKYLDVFLGPLLTRALPRAAGAVGGAMTEHMAPGWGIGMLIGLEAAGAGHGTTGILQNLYAAPREALRARLGEAIRDPQIATDLMRKAGSAVSPATRAWARSVLAIEPASGMARTTGETP